MPNIIVSIVFVLFFFMPASVQSIVTKQIGSSCLCDVSDACDYQCCCDAQCTQILKNQLKQHDKCGDDGFGIPWCQGFNETDIHVRDLYSGLSTIYTIVRRLFCLQRINIVDPTQYYTISSQSTLLDNLIAEQQLSQKSAQPSRINSLSKHTINKIFMKNMVGICSITNQIPQLYSIPSSSNTKRGVEKCRINIGTISSNPILNLENLLADSAFANINIYNINQQTKLNPTLYTGTRTPSCTTTTCSNILRAIKLYITQQGTIDLTYSYAYIGNIQLSVTALTDISQIYVNIEYSYEYLNSDNTLPKSISQGYNIGSKLVLINNIGTTYVHCPNPINIAYRTSLNTCRTAADISQNSLISLQFGKNAQYGCIGTTSLIYDNLKASFNYVGKYGAAGTQLGDYNLVSWPNIDASSSVKLLFNYIRVGAQNNWQYYIVRVDVNVVQSMSVQQTLYIEYVEVSNQQVLYVPEPPQIDTYLPNDFLYPFYVVG